MNLNLGRTSIPIRCIVERVLNDKDNKLLSGSSGLNLSITSNGNNLSSTGLNTLLNNGNQSPRNTSSPESGVSSGNGSSIQTPPQSLQHLTTQSLPTLTSSTLTNTGTQQLTNEQLVNNLNAIEQDTYAIIPSGVLLTDLVKTALLRLGYPSTEIVGAKGYIQLKNWKQLTIDQLTDSSDATVGDILGDICPAVILRIRLNRPRTNGSNELELKDKLLQILLAHSYSLLVNSGCPVDQSMLAAFCGPGQRGGKEFDASEETANKFDQWYLQQVFNHYRRIATLAAAQAHQQQVAAAAVAVAAEVSQQQQHQQHSNKLNSNYSSLLGVDLDHHSSQNNPPILNQLLDQHAGLSPLPSDHHQQQQQFVRTRIRTSFDPELELPKLHKWFTENQHPSRAMIQQYVKELNALESRKGRKPLDVNNVVYWFKNARAAHKRQELKLVNGNNSPTMSNCNSTHSYGSREGNDGKDIRDGSESEGKESQDENHHDDDEDDEEMEDQEDFSGENIDDDCSQISQTLDLSVRNGNRIKSEITSPCSPLLNQHISISEKSNTLKLSNNNNNNNHNIRDDQVSDEDDEMNDLDDYYGTEIGSYTNTLNGSKNYSHSSNNHNNNNNNSNTNNGTNNHNNTPNSDCSDDSRRIRRSRTFIDPMTEVPRLEQWFMVNTHPTHSQIVKYTEEINSLPYRQKFPKLESKNIQFWFKNRRAKYKRLNLPSQIANQTSTQNAFPLTSSPLPLTTSTTALTCSPTSNSSANALASINRSLSP